MRNPEFHKLLNEVKRMHDMKNEDYGQDEDPLSNLKGCVRMGDHPTKGIAIRLQDKMSRIESYFKKGSLKNESLRDSFLDMGIYALLAVTILDGENTDDSQPGRSTERTNIIDATPTFAGDGCAPYTCCGPEAIGISEELHNKVMQAKGPEPKTAEEILGERYADRKVHLRYDTDECADKGAEN